MDVSKSEKAKLKSEFSVPHPDIIKEEFWRELDSQEARENPPYDMNEIFERSKAMDYREIARNVTRRHEVRFARKEDFRFYWKAPALTIGAGLPGLILVLLAIFLPALLGIAGMELSRAGGGMGLVRLGIAFAGFLLLMLALPVYKPSDWSPQRDRELESERQRYHEKRFGNRD